MTGRGTQRRKVFPCPVQPGSDFYFLTPFIMKEIKMTFRIYEEEHYLCHVDAGNERDAQAEVLTFAKKHRDLNKAGGPGGVEARLRSHRRCVMPCGKAAVEIERTLNLCPAPRVTGDSIACSANGQRQRRFAIGLCRLRYYVGVATARSGPEAFEHIQTFVEQTDRPVASGSDGIEVMPESMHVEIEEPCIAS